MRFRLNHRFTHLAPGETDISVWVGKLSSEVDEFALYSFFTERYETVRYVKVRRQQRPGCVIQFLQVVMNEFGVSKGYGFVRFGSEYEQQHALSLTGQMGLGSKSIKVKPRTITRGSERSAQPAPAVLHRASWPGIGLVSGAQAETETGPMAVLSIQSLALSLDSI